MKDFFKWIPESGLEPWFETAPYQPRRLVPVAPEGGARLLFHDVRSRRGAELVVSSPVTAKRSPTNLSFFWSSLWRQWRHDGKAGTPEQSASRAMQGNI